MESQTTDSLPFTSQQQMSALAGTATLVCLQFNKTPEQTVLFAHAAQLMSVSGVLRGLLIASEETTAAVGPQQDPHVRAAEPHSSYQQHHAPQTVPLDDEDTAAWGTVLSMLYPQTMLSKHAAISTDIKAVEALLLLADKYDMPLVTDKCRQVLESRIPPDGFLTAAPAMVFQWLYILRKFRLTNLTSICMEYIAKKKLNMSEDCFTRLDPACLQQLHSKLQDQLLQELRAARKDAKDALIREKRSRSQAANAKEEITALKGMLEKNQVHHVHSRLPLKHVALGANNQYVVVWENGLASWSSNIPQELQDHLTTYTRNGGGVGFVSLGRGGTSKDVGGYWCVGDEQGNLHLGRNCEGRLLNLVESNLGDDRVQKVWFGVPSNGDADADEGAIAWVALKKNGHVEHSDVSQHLPADLNAAIVNNGVEHVSLGFGRDVYFVLDVEGNSWWSELPSTLQKVFELDSDITGGTEWVELGDDGCFVASFEEYTVWCGTDVLTKLLLEALGDK